MQHNSNMFNHRINLLILAGSLGLISVQAHSGEEATSPRWYQIELVFFEPVLADPANEDWPVIIESELPADLIEPAAPIQPLAALDNPAIEPNAYQLLNPEKFSLTGLADKLVKKNQYRVISHLAWRQPAVDKARALPVHIHDLPMQKEINENVGRLVLSDDPQLLNPLTENIERESLASSPLVPEGGHIDGSITLSLARYLHLRTDISYINPDVYLAEQIARQDTESPSVERFVLRESRRMRSKEIHYFDHPYFGIITLVTPYERPVPVPVAPSPPISQPGR